MKSHRRWSTGAKLSYYYEMYRKIRLLYAAPKILNYIKYRVLPRNAITLIQRYTPQICTLLLTTRCNLNCGYCNAGKIIHENKDGVHANEATLDKVKLIFANPLFANCLLVDLGGGEPLLVKDLNDIIRYLTARGHITNLITNGVFLADRIAELKRAGVSRINISLYDTNRSVMQRDLEKINRVFPVHASIVLLRSQIENKPDSILETARFVRDAGCRSLRFWIYRPMGVSPNSKEIIADTLPAYLEFRRRADEALPGFCFWPATIQTGEFKKLCPQLWQRIGCDMLGNIIICCGIDTVLKDLNSNLFNSDPDIIFNHPTLTKMREQLLDSTSEPPDICKNCNLLGESGW